MARARSNLFTLCLTSTLLLTGCGSPVSQPAAPVGVTSSAVPPSAAAPSSESSPAQAGAASPSSEPTAGAREGDGPAGMVCGDEIRGQVAQILGLSSNPSPARTVQDGRYTCSYQTSSGPLVLSVQQSASAAAAKAYFDSTQPTLNGMKPIEGLANLGLPASQSPDGMVMFVKDNMTLTVDASRLPKSVGPHGVSPGAVAYQLATDVIACWTDH